MPLTDSQPVSQVRWIHRDLLDQNNYNPNASPKEQASSAGIAPPELELLKLSILEDGWTMPIVTLPEQNGRFVIVDGYHRWKVSAEKQVYALTGGLVPTVQVALDPIHRQLSTVRHNRARGTHAVLKMADIVRTILADGVSEKELMQRLGMEREEVARLNNRAGMPDQIKATSFNSAWVPRRADPS